MQRVTMGMDGSVVPVTLGGSQVVLIAGPCVIESAEHTHRMAAQLKALAEDAGLPFVFRRASTKPTEPRWMASAGLVQPKGCASYLR